MQTNSWLQRNGLKLSPVRPVQTMKACDKLGKIVNLRWLNELDETHLKEKSEKYLWPLNCDRLITPTKGES